MVELSQLDFTNITGKLSVFYVDLGDELTNYLCFCLNLLIENMDFQGME